MREREREFSWGQGDYTGFNLIARHEVDLGLFDEVPCFAPKRLGNIKAARPVGWEPTRVSRPGAFVRGARIRDTVGLKR